MKRSVSTLGVACLVVIGILFCGPVSAFFDDFESETVGNPPLNWTAIWQPIKVANNGGLLWASKFVCGPAQNNDDQMSVVTGLVLGDCRIEVDHINMGSGGGAGGSGLVFLRCQNMDRANGLFLNILGPQIYFHWKIDGAWGPALGLGAWSDSQNHHGQNAHIVITARGEHVEARATLIDNPSVFAESIVDLSGLWPEGNVGLLISERTNPPYASGFDNFRAEALAGTLTGYIDLEDYDLSKPKLALVEIRFVPTLGGELRTEYVELDPNNINYNYTVQQVKEGTYDIYYTACKWLTKKETGVAFTSGNTTVKDVALKNGDLDGDNGVTSTDLSVSLKNIDQMGDN